MDKTKKTHYAIPYYSTLNNKVNLLSLHTKNEDEASVISKVLCGSDILVVLDENNEIWPI